MQIERHILAIDAIPPTETTATRTRGSPVCALPALSQTRRQKVVAALTLPRTPSTSKPSHLSRLITLACSAAETLPTYLTQPVAPSRQDVLNIRHTCVERNFGPGDHIHSSSFRRLVRWCNWLNVIVFRNSQTRSQRNKHTLNGKRFVWRGRSDGRSDRRLVWQRGRHNHAVNGGACLGHVVIWSDRRSLGWGQYSVWRYQGPRERVWKYFDPSVWDRDSDRHAQPLRQ